jgi:uncharacterized membrane protein YkvA (DUF1232 family)
MQPTQQPPYPYDPNYAPNAAVPVRGGRAKDITVALLAAFGLIYIFIPSVIPDFVPDFIPLVGQIDDDLAVLLILNSLRYFGYDLAVMVPGIRWILNNRKQTEKPKNG